MTYPASSHHWILISKDCLAAKAAHCPVLSSPSLLTGTQTPSSPFPWRLPFPNSSKPAREWPPGWISEQNLLSGKQAHQHCLVIPSDWFLCLNWLGECIWLPNCLPRHRAHISHGQGENAAKGGPCEQTEGSFRMWKNVITQAGVSCQTHLETNLLCWRKVNNLP